MPESNRGRGWTDVTSLAGVRDAVEGAVAGGSTRSASAVAVRTARAVAFWAAIVLPFLHLPLLVTGLSTRAELVAFAVLLGCNVVAVRVGAGYRPAAGGRDR